MGKTIRKSTFRARLLEIFITLIIIQGVAIILTFYQQTRNMALDLSNQITSEVVEKTEERVTTYLSTPASLTRTTSSIINYDNIIEEYEYLWRYMWQPLVMVPQIESFFIADTTGNYVQVRRSPKLATRTINRNIEPVIDKRLYRNEQYEIVEITEKGTSFDPRTRPWYINISEDVNIQQRYYWTEPYIGTTSQKPVIGCAFPILNEEENLRAVVCVNIPLESLSIFLKKQKISENSSVFIIDSKENIIAFPDFNRVLLKDSENQKMRLRKFSEIDIPHLKEVYLQSSGADEEFLSKQKNDNYFTTIKSISTDIGLDWRIITTIPESELLKNVFLIIKRIILVFIGIFIISITFIVIISRSITKPIVALSLKNEKLQNFDLDLGDRVKSSISEISHMCDSLFNAVAGLAAFKKYVPADLVRNLIATGQEANVGGVPKYLTILFTDIEGFTSISEKTAPDFLMQHLSEYFDSLSNIVMKHHGTIDKYIGDSIMAFWGAPIANDNSEIDACYAALACQKVLNELNHNWNDRKKPVMKTRIGIASGDIIVGNMGSTERINYSVIGDSVNLASRLEGINKYYGTKIIISSRVYYKVKDHFHCRFLDNAAVLGKHEGVQIFELIAPKAEILTRRKQLFLSLYAKGMDAYLNKEWNDALKYFFGIRKELKIIDSSVDLFIKRTQYFRKTGHLLPDDWDGVTRFSVK